MFGTDESRKIAEALSALFRKKKGTRTLGKIRLIYNEETGEFSMTAWLGAHNGPEIDLCKRNLNHADPRAQAVFKVINPFTDEAVAQAIASDFWSVSDKSKEVEGDLSTWEYSEGNKNFAAEALASVAVLATRL